MAREAGSHDSRFGGRIGTHSAGSHCADDHSFDNRPGYNHWDYNRRGYIGLAAKNGIFYENELLISLFDFTWVLNNGPAWKVFRLEQALAYKIFAGTPTSICPGSRGEEIPPI